MLAALLAVGGCATKAAYLLNADGSYTLQTATDSLDEAMKRFQRTAADLCPAGNYAFGEPVADRRSTPITYDVEMTCALP